MDDVNSPPPNYVAPQSRLEIAFCRRLLNSMLPSERVRLDFGETNTASKTDRPEADFVLAPPRLGTLLKLMLAPNLWVGESFIAGKWYLKKGNLSEFLLAGTTEASAAFRAYYDLTVNLKDLRHCIGQYLLNRYYTRRVRDHYEVDSAIYELILDDEMLYTCAFFDPQHDSLPAAQQNKLDIVIERMNLPSGSARALDIGCGWGAMARGLVRRHPGVEVCGLSISENQIAWAKKKDAACLTQPQSVRIEYRLEDYIDHPRSNHYDAVSVIGMLEHVGLAGYKHFFAKIHDVLKQGGKAVIHTIVSPTPGVPTNNWIDKHIFTGGYAPSISELVGAVERHGFHIAGLHMHPAGNYKKTIECWLDNLLKNTGAFRSHLAGLNYGREEIDRFMRIWVFYLSGVRNMFVGGGGEKCHQIAQLALTKL
jgi:cyclopropane-fatty-acyl-phospholipid synthase